MRARIWIEVDISDGAVLADVAERVFNLVASDPDDVIPEIQTVDNYGEEQL